MGAIIRSNNAKRSIFFFILATMHAAPLLGPVCYIHIFPALWSFAAGVNRREMDVVNNI